MVIQGMKISQTGDVSADGHDDSGPWSITGKVNREELDDKGKMAVTIEKRYEEYTIYYQGKINA